MLPDNPANWDVPLCIVAPPSYVVSSSCWRFGVSGRGNALDPMTCSIRTSSRKRIPAQEAADGGVVEACPQIDQPRGVALLTGELEGLSGRAQGACCLAHPKGVGLVRLDYTARGIRHRTHRAQAVAVGHADGACAVYRVGQALCSPDVRTATVGDDDWQTATDVVGVGIDGAHRPGELAVAIVGVGHRGASHLRGGETVRLVVGKAVTAPNDDVAGGIHGVGSRSGRHDAIRSVVGVGRGAHAGAVAHRVVPVRRRPIAHQPIQRIVPVGRVHGQRRAAYLSQRLGNLGAGAHVVQRVGVLADGGSRALLVPHLGQPLGVVFGVGRSRAMDIGG